MVQDAQPIDLNSVVPAQSELLMSEEWRGGIHGIFKYRIQNTWDGRPVDHPPVVFTLEGFEAGVELNISAPFFNDPAPEGPSGKPFYGLWNYEVMEIFFLNDAGEYLEVEVGPHGQHLLLPLPPQ